MAFSGSGAITDQVSKALRRPGRLVAAPTTVSGSFPYGGTSLGLVAKGAEFLAPPIFTPLRCLNDRGQEPFDYLYVGSGEVILRLDLVQQTNDTLQLAYPGRTTSGATRRHIQDPGSLALGALGSGEALKFAFIPEDITNDDALLIRKGIPSLARDGSLWWKVNRNQGDSYDIAIRVTRDTAAADAEERWVVGKWADLTI